MLGHCPALPLWGPGLWGRAVEDYAVSRVLTAWPVQRQGLQQREIDRVWGWGCRQSQGPGSPTLHLQNPHCHWDLTPVLSHLPSHPCCTSVFMGLLKCFLSIVIVRFGWSGHWLRTFWLGRWCRCAHIPHSGDSLKGS